MTMTTPPTMPELLDTLAAIAESVMDSGAPSDEHNACPICTLNATQATEHDMDCAYRIARTRLSPANLQAVRRLARALGSVG
jgi:hypothetical protein